MSSLWNRLPFIGRLLVTASLALLVAGAAMVFVSARQEASEIRADLQGELTKELETMSGALVETVVIGDFSTLQQILDRYVRRPLVAAVEFQDISGTVLSRRDASPPAEAPEWFQSLFGFSDIGGSVAVTVGGRRYGELAITLTAREPSNRAWRHLKSHMSILLLAVALDFVGIWLVLRSGLSPLQQLVAGTQAVADGRFDALPAPVGSPELRHVIDSFNRMAESVRETQEALRRSEERLQLAINGVNDGIWDWDLWADRLYLSPKWKEMAGYADHELPNSWDTVDRLLHPDDKDVFRSARERYLDGRAANFAVEFRFLHKDGSWRWILGRGEALRDGDGIPYRMAGSHTDITVRKNLQDMLQAKTLELGTILDNSSVGITFVKERRQIWANRRMGELFGYGAAAMENRSTRMFYLADEAYEALGREAYPVLARGERYTTEREMRHADGHALWVRISGKRIAAPAMEGGSIWVFEDISEQKRTEAELHRARENAEAANVAKSRFLATMSHEIRTPLNGMLGMAQLLLLPDLGDDERQDFARTILNSGQILLALLNDILDVSKVEAGKLELERASFAAGRLVDETAQLFGESAQQKRLALESAWLGPAGECYQGDSIRIRQMLSNLVNNAIKFTAQGAVRIAGREVERQGESALLEFVVEDSGIGIAPERQSLLFQPFAQGDSSTTRQYGGTGLGLSIVRSLAELMGGEVGVDSDAGAGSRFWFRIRVGLVAVAVAAKEEGGKGEPAVETPPAPLESPAPTIRWVLVVEDNATNRKVVESMLRKQGIDVGCAGNGQEALDVLQAGNRPDLVLMDCQMPVLDGFAATARIRAWENENCRDRLPIVALTAGAFPEDRERCLACGMDDFLAKPLVAGELRAVLEKWGVLAGAGSE